MRETAWQLRICKVVRYHGGFASKWHSASMVGVPDLIVINNYGTGFVEVKKLEVKSWEPTKHYVKLTVKQLSTLLRIYDAGGQSHAMTVFEGPGMTQFSITPIQHCEMVDRAKVVVLEPQFDWKDLQKNPEWLVTGCPRRKQ